jgi:hypothetical protein
MSSKPTSIKIDDVEYVRKDLLPTPAPAGPESIIRTQASGVHIGEVTHREGREVTLKNARRLWSWQGAFTLNEVATKGVKRKDSRISCAVPSIYLLDAIEVIPVTSGVDLSTTEK